MPPWHRECVFATAVCATWKLGAVLLVRIKNDAHWEAPCTHLSIHKCTRFAVVVTEARTFLLGAVVITGISLTTDNSGLTNLATKVWWSVDMPPSLLMYTNALFYDIIILPFGLKNIHTCKYICPMSLKTHTGIFRAELSKSDECDVCDMPFTTPLFTTFTTPLIDAFKIIEALDFIWAFLNVS